MAYVNTLLFKMENARSVLLVLLDEVTNDHHTNVIIVDRSHRGRPRFDRECPERWCPESCTRIRFPQLSAEKPEGFPLAVADVVAVALISTESPSRSPWDWNEFL